MACSNIDIKKFLTDKSDASMEAIEKKCSDSLLLHMLEDGLYADITFQAKGGTVKVHRSVLAAASPIFKEMFQQQMKEQEPPSTVSLPQFPDMVIEILELFLVLLYITNEKTKAMPEFNEAVDKHFIALFDAAHKFQVEGRLNAVLEDGLLRHLTPENCWEFYHKCEDLALISEFDFAEACLSYVMNNCEMVMRSATTLLEMQRNPNVVQRCITEALSKGLCCEFCRQRTTPKRKKPSSQTPDHSISAGI